MNATDVCHKCGRVYDVESGHECEEKAMTTPTLETPPLSERMLEEAYVGGIAGWDDIIDEVAKMELRLAEAEKDRRWLIDFATQQDPWDDAEDRMEFDRIAALAHDKEKP